MPASWSMSPSAMHAQLGAAVCVATLAAAPSLVLAVPKGKGKFRGGFWSSSSDSPKFYYQYEEGFQNGGSGIWVPSESSGPRLEDGCVFWSGGDSPTADWKVSCAEPRLKTWIYIVGALLLGLILCFCMCVCVAMFEKKPEGMVEESSSAQLAAAGDDTEMAGTAAGDDKKEQRQSVPAAQTNEVAHVHVNITDNQQPTTYEVQGQHTGYSQQQQAYPPQQQAAYPPVSQQQLQQGQSQQVMATYPLQ